MAAIRSSTSKDHRFVRWAKLASSIGIAALVGAVASSAIAQPGPSPTYQRKGTFAEQGHDKHRDFRHQRMPQFSSQTSAGSFQRPYPYHLDYYRAKWGGSYAPYFGNLYGPPNYFINGVPFVNGFGPFNGFNNVGGFNSFGFPGIGFQNQFGDFGGPGFGGPGFNGGWGGAPYGPWAGEFMGAEGMPVDAEVAP
jgi:hypothetical protein